LKHVGAADRPGYPTEEECQRIESIMRTELAVAAERKEEEPFL
jgi:hypothetical protein